MGLARAGVACVDDDRASPKRGKQRAKLFERVPVEGLVIGVDRLANAVQERICLRFRECGHVASDCVGCIDRTQCPIDVINLPYFAQTCKLLESWQRSCCAYVRVRDCACVDLVCWCGQGTGESHGNKGQTGGRRGRVSPYSANLLAGAACVTLCFRGFVLWCQS